MADTSSSQRLTPERAPRLRDLADRLEQQAHTATSPAGALALARRMRIRATELECAEHDDLEDADKEIKAAAFGA